ASGFPNEGNALAPKEVEGDVAQGAKLPLTKAASDLEVLRQLPHLEDRLTDLLGDGIVGWGEALVRHQNFPGKSETFGRSEVKGSLRRHADLCCGPTWTSRGRI